MSTLRMMRQVLTHPYDFFQELREPGRIRWYRAPLLVLLAFAAKMASILVTGFAFQTREAYQVSSLFELVWIVVPWATWCVANWGVSSILDGEGRFAEVVHGSAFALVPYILFVVPVTLLTRWLALDESGIYEFLMLLVLGWSGWLMLLMVRIVHDFETGKMLFIVLLTLVGMGIIWFIFILLFGLMSQFVYFVLDLAKEIRLRG
jgi:hypothetical protein